MQNLDRIAEDLFNKIRGRFSSIKIGDEQGKVTLDPSQGRFFDFEFYVYGKVVGNVTIGLREGMLEVFYNRDAVADEVDHIRRDWFDFLRNLRTFARRKALTFSARDIVKTNLTTRDYEYLVNTRTGDKSMRESKNHQEKTKNYEWVGNAKLLYKYNLSAGVNETVKNAKRMHVIFIENANGERYIYPFKHVNGAKALARHVSEGGHPYDAFGKYIMGLSEELLNLRKFKRYVSRPSVMAENLNQYMDIVNERVESVKKTISRIQKQGAYETELNNFREPVFEQVPSEVKENWIDELTIKQFNEELTDIFPYIYNLIKEGLSNKSLDYFDLEAELNNK